MENLSSLILSWNEKQIVEENIDLMMAEGIDVWVVDNGSEDGTQEMLKGKDCNVIQLPENIGAGPARNKVIEAFDSEYLLMIDSDILYIPKSAKGLLKAFKKLEDGYVLGIHHPLNDGIDQRTQADKRWKYPGDIKSDIALAWTQYGLFKGDLLKKNKFPEHGPFYGPGYGYEDDYLHALMEEDGYKSYYCTKPLYYHKAHTTKRTFRNKKLDTREEERKNQLKKDFPEYKDWRTRVKEQNG